MTATPKNALRRPVLTDTANVPRDIQNLADDVDGRLITYCTEVTPSDTRPTGTARYAGALIYCTDTKAYGFWDAGASVWRMYDTVPQIGTPTWGTSGSAGAMNASGRKSYTMRKGAEITSDMTFTWSALGGGEGLGTGFYLFTLPYAPSSGIYVVDMPIGTGSVLDAGLALYSGSVNIWDSTRCYINTTNGKLTNSVPIASPTNSDAYFLSVRYFTA